MSDDLWALAALVIVYERILVKSGVILMCGHFALCEQRIQDWRVVLRIS